VIVKDGIGGDREVFTAILAEKPIFSIFQLSISDE
jgi:hypothetical protein